MKGKVLDFNLQADEGIISGVDGQRYSFTKAEWKSLEINPAQNVEVDFGIEDDKAIAIYAEVPANNVDPQGIFQHYLNAFRNYANFSGRATRSAFWHYELVSFVVAVILSAISAGFLGIIYGLGVMVPSWAIGARRLHDTGRSGWWQLISLIPLIGIIVLIVFWAQDSQKEKNKFDIN